jgi:hypothetical protein
MAKKSVSERNGNQIEIDMPIDLVDQLSERFRLLLVPFVVGVAENSQH